MIWSYDADESISFPSGVASPPVLSCHAPAAIVAGARRTARTHRPSLRALEAAEASSSALDPRAKRKAPSDPDQDRRVTRKVIADVDDDDSDTGNDGATTEPATELADDEYESIKAMADADSQVCSHCSQFRIPFSFTSQAATFKPREERTADIRLIFRRDREYVHPDTGKTLDGQWCTVCR
jgi:hypothetical protein